MLAASLGFLLFWQPATS